MTNVSDRKPHSTDGAVEHQALSPWRLLSPAILLLGAGCYALVEGPGKVTFFITPLTVGLIAVIAGLVGRDRHLVPAGLGIAGWGVGVALVFYSVVPAARTTPAYMVGLAGGVLLASYVAPRGDRGSWTHSAAVAAVTAAVFFFLDYSYSSFGRWPAWALSLVIWAAWLIIVPFVPTGGQLRRKEPAPATGR